MTVLLVAFLLAHGFVHLAVWLAPRPDPAKGPAPPFAPDHSAVLSAVHVPHGVARAVSHVMAVVSAAGFVGTGIGVAAGDSWAPDVAVLAAIAGLALKAGYFNRWLTLGVALDLLVLAMALDEWPVALG